MPTQVRRQARIQSAEVHDMVPQGVPHRSVVITSKGNVWHAIGWVVQCHSSLTETFWLSLELAYPTARGPGEAKTVFCQCSAELILSSI
jgi:hypothetical protein